MRAKLTVIEGGLCSGETLVMKLLNRPEDFPEGIFQRVLKQHQRQLSFSSDVLDPPSVVHACLRS